MDVDVFIVKHGIELHDYSYFLGLCSSLVSLSYSLVLVPLWAYGCDFIALIFMRLLSGIS